MDVVQQFLMDQVLNELDDLKSNATQWLVTYGFVFDINDTVLSPKDIPAHNAQLFKDLSKDSKYLRDPDVSNYFHATSFGCRLNLYCHRLRNPPGILLLPVDLCSTSTSGTMQWPSG